jgi:transposase-like protein
MIDRKVRPTKKELQAAVDTKKSLEEIAHTFGVSRRTFYRWLQLADVGTKHPVGIRRRQQRDDLEQEIDESRKAVGLKPRQPAARTCLRCGVLFNSTDAANRRCLDCYDCNLDNYDPSVQYSLGPWNRIC